MPPPIIRTPFSDLFPAGYSHQSFGNCMNFEDRYLQCAEAYGQRLAEVKCALYKEDLVECNTKEKQIKRIMLMEKERERQIKAGERPPGKEYMEKPDLNAYQGTFFGTKF